MDRRLAQKLIMSKKCLGELKKTAVKLSYPGLVYGTGERVTGALILQGKLQGA